MVHVHVHLCTCIAFASRQESKRWHPMIRHQLFANFFSVEKKSYITQKFKIFQLKNWYISQYRYTDFFASVNHNKVLNLATISRSLELSCTTQPMKYIFSEIFVNMSLYGFQNKQTSGKSSKPLYFTSIHKRQLKYLKGLKS